MEKAIQFLTQRWWRTAKVATVEDAQASLDVFCATIADARARLDVDGTASTVAVLADQERLRPLPATRWPNTLVVKRKVAANATVSFRGNHYAVDPASSARRCRCRCWSGCTPSTSSIRPRGC